MEGDSECVGNRLTTETLFKQESDDTRGNLVISEKKRDLVKEQTVVYIIVSHSPLQFSTFCLIVDVKIAVSSNVISMHIEEIL